jgi:hypothetical protein
VFVDHFDLSLKRGLRTPHGWVSVLMCIRGSTDTRVNGIVSILRCGDIDSTNPELKLLVAG